MIISNSGETLFSGHNVVSTSDYIYNSSNASSSSDGWTTARSDNLAIAYGLTALNATNLSIRIEGKFPTYGRACNIYTATLTAVTSIDEIVNIAESVNEIRVGVKVNNTASPNTFYCGVVRAEVK